MKNITLSADATSIKRAKLVARVRRTTLDAAFRNWLEEYVAQAEGRRVDILMHELRRLRSAGPYTRDQMNER